MWSGFWKFWNWVNYIASETGVDRRKFKGIGENRWENTSIKNLIKMRKTL